MFSRIILIGQTDHVTVCTFNGPINVKVTKLYCWATSLKLKGRQLGFCRPDVFRSSLPPFTCDLLASQTIHTGTGSRQVSESTCHCRNCFLFLRNFRAEMETELMSVNDLWGTRHWMSSDTVDLLLLRLQKMFSAWLLKFPKLLHKERHHKVTYFSPNSSDCVALFRQGRTKTSGCNGEKEIREQKAKSSCKWL